MKKTIIAGGGIATILLVAGLFSVFTGEKGENADTINDRTGTIQYIDLEGGFYGIMDDHENKYDPINLPEEFKEHGLRVKFSAKIREDIGSFHMWGTVIELTDIQQI
jgi:hypothetical protein